MLSPAYTPNFGQLPVAKV
ncbi:hypothetical protein PG365_14980 [Providencia vermicola]|uniref:Uncharacterized protein n=1 Tax=Providencia vermicola TaxID=333965 RepID=A0AAX3S1E6_9GAMM|nr:MULTISPECIES: hypothetical protein [Providencia]USB38761.1 hypothetical protein M5J11_00635 [Providencia vermicola]WFC08677.1 hypothetical protein PG365_14980 [Providencia vermicola]